MFYNNKIYDMNYILNKIYNKSIKHYLSFLYRNNIIDLSNIIDNKNIINYIKDYNNLDKFYQFIIDNTELKLDKFIDDDVYKYIRKEISEYYYRLSYSS